MCIKVVPDIVNYPVQTVMEAMNTTEFFAAESDTVEHLDYIKGNAKGESKYSVTLAKTRTQKISLMTVCFFF